MAGWLSRVVTADQNTVGTNPPLAAGVILGDLENIKESSSASSVPTHPYVQCGDYGKTLPLEEAFSPTVDVYRQVIPEALRTVCAKCTPKQRELVRIVVRAFQEKLPELWEELVKKEDPTGQYKESFNNFLQGTD
ncbi:jg6691 [Pararge aegeria aegeria]|uniref:Jg6691 protein n=1 Tax=Pararge aegeria aegeria TaxID=348720 RepID=A0A8S4SMB0_9NEOP|nr:jg6691 [Pararge aegeria aegeria]